MQPRRDGPFQALERINDNTYQLDLLVEYNINATFSVFDLSSFDYENEDSRSNPYGERENDANPRPLKLSSEPTTRSKAKQLNDALNGLIQQIWRKNTKLGNQINSNTCLTLLIQIRVGEGPFQPYRAKWLFSTSVTRQQPHHYMPHQPPGYRRDYSNASLTRS